jgi:hypothetical protein
MKAPGLSGGEGLKRRLEEIRRNLGQGEELRLGFLEGSTYPDGTPTASVAAIQEFGATIKVEAHQTTIFRKIDKSGDFMKSGRFVKQNLSNFATTHDVPAHTVTIPARPYFRHMIEAKSSGWGAAMAKNLKATDNDGAAALEKMGEVIQGQLKQSIRDFVDPPLAPSTIKAKGFPKPLIDTGHMRDSVAFEVTKEGDDHG